MDIDRGGDACIGIVRHPLRHRELLRRLEPDPRRGPGLRTPYRQSGRRGGTTRRAWPAAVRAGPLRGGQKPIWARRCRRSVSWPTPEVRRPRSRRSVRRAGSRPISRRRFISGTAAPRGRATGRTRSRSPSRRRGCAVRTRTSFVEKSDRDRDGRGRAREPPLRAQRQSARGQHVGRRGEALRQARTTCCPCAIAVPIGKLGLVPSGDRYEGQFFVYFAVLDVSGKQSDLQIQRQQVSVPAKDFADGAAQGLLLRRPAHRRAGRAEDRGRRPRRGVQPDLLPPEERLRLGVAEGEAHGAGAQAVIPILDARRMRAADAATIRRGTPSDELMESAAAGLCARARRRLSRLAARRRRLRPRQQRRRRARGGAAARAAGRRRVDLFTLGDPDAYRGDPAANLGARRARSAWRRPRSPREAGSRRSRGALGRGRRRRGRALRDGALARRSRAARARAVEAINASGRPVVAADVPSGLSADTAAPSRARPCGPRLTVAFGAPEALPRALPPASGLCGRVVVADIGIPRADARAAGAAALARGARPTSRQLLPAAAARIAQGGLRTARDRRRLARKGRGGDPGRARRAARRRRPRHGLLRASRSRASSSRRCPRR